jgi:hypothetical protein
VGPSERIRAVQVRNDILLAPSVHCFTGFDTSALIDHRTWLHGAHLVHLNGGCRWSTRLPEAGDPKRLGASAVDKRPHAVGADRTLPATPSEAGR